MTLRPLRDEVNADGHTPVIIPMAVASVQRLGHRALGKLEPPSRAVPRAGDGVIHPNYPRLSAGFGFRSRGSASGAGSQPNTLRPPKLCERRRSSAITSGT